MSVKIITGNIFTSECQVIVNTVNCVGVMGAGIALEYRLRYPEMYEKYIKLCDDGRIDIGLLWIYKTPSRWVLNFPTKKHWKYPSKKEYLHAGLEKFYNTYKEKNIESVAFPLLGADRGGIDQSESINIMKEYLSTVDIEVEIYRYDIESKDDLYEKFKNKVLSKDISEISRETGLRESYVEKVIGGLYQPNICQLNQLLRVKGVGIKTLEKIFFFVTDVAD